MGPESEIPADTKLLRAFLKELWTVLFILEPGFQRDEDDYFHLNLQDWAWESKGDKTDLVNSNMGVKETKAVDWSKISCFDCICEAVCNPQCKCSLNCCHLNVQIQTQDQLLCFSKCHSNSLAVGMALKWFLHLHDSLTRLKGEDPPLFSAGSYYGRCLCHLYFSGSAQTRVLMSTRTRPCVRLLTWFVNAQETIQAPSPCKWLGFPSFHHHHCTSLMSINHGRHAWLHVCCTIAAYRCNSSVQLHKPFRIFNLTYLVLG